jgi:hypothetical protein
MTEEGLNQIQKIEVNINIGRGVKLDKEIN